MVKVKIKCIYCKSEEVVKMGYKNNGTPRCKCKRLWKDFSNILPE